jgi:hypothetical protein
MRGEIRVMTDALVLRHNGYKRYARPVAAWAQLQDIYLENRQYLRADAEHGHCAALTSTKRGPKGPLLHCWLYRR